RLENSKPDVKSHEHEQQAQNERYAPAPDQELVAGHLAEREHGQVGEEEPAGHAELRPGGDESAGMIRARPFHRHQHRAAPFAADADTLDEAQDGENDSAPETDAFVARH